MSAVVSATKAKLPEALPALSQYLANRRSEELPELVSADNADVVTLNIRLASIPVKKQLRYETVKLPNPLIDAYEASVCLIVRDPKEKAEAKVEAAGVKVAKVLAIKSLKKKYKSPEAKRELCNRFDVFLAEEEITEMLPTLLGRYFFEVKKHKIPIAIDAISKPSFDRALNSTRFRLSTGATLGVRIGKLDSMTHTQIIQNVETVLPVVEQYLAKKGNGVIGVDVQVTNSISLPVYIKKVEDQVETKKAETKKAETKKSQTKKVASKKRAAASDDSDSEEVEKSLSSLSVTDLKNLANKKKQKRVTKA